MMLRYSFDLPDEANGIEQAVSAVLDEGFRTADIMQTGCRKVTCTEMGNMVAQKI